MQKVILVHIPKTAGQSLRYMIHQSPLKGHDTLSSVEDKVDLNDYFKFAFVRNPWDRAVSLYHYFLMRDSRIQEIKVHPRMPEEEKLLRYEVIAKQAEIVGGYKDFNEFIHDFPSIVRMDKTMTLQQSHWLDPRLDFIGRFENLVSDSKRICARIGKRYQPTHINKSNHGPYEGYYNPESIQLINDIYAEDIELLGYSFKG